MGVVESVLQGLDTLLVLRGQRPLALGAGRFVPEQLVQRGAADQFFDGDSQPRGYFGDILVEELGFSCFERNDGRPSDADALGQLFLGEAGAFACPSDIVVKEVIKHARKIYDADGLHVPEKCDNVHKKRTDM